VLFCLHVFTQSFSSKTAVIYVNTGFFINKIIRENAALFFGWDNSQFDLIAKALQNWPNLCRFGQCSANLAKALQIFSPICHDPKFLAFFTLLYETQTEYIVDDFSISNTFSILTNIQCIF